MESFTIPAHVPRTVEDAPVRHPVLLQVNDLSAVICTDRGEEVRAVDRVSFHVSQAETVGVLGESGSGKSTMASILLQAMVSQGRVLCGSVLFKGRDLVALSEIEMRKIRGAEVAMIHQDSSVLNPVLRVGAQIAEVFHAHHDCTVSQGRAEASQMLEAVGLEPSRYYRAYPHQLSGGQRQRVVIAQALVCRPSLVVADEPTASLDADTAREILQLLITLKKQLAMAIILISHDASVLKAVSDRILVMYAGQIVEQGPADQIFDQPLHPYTRALLACAAPGPAAGTAKSGKRRLPFIPGNSPDLIEPFPGCCFESRCSDRFELCQTKEPDEVEAQPQHRVRCLHFER